MTKGGRGRGINQEFEMNVYVPLYVKQITNKGVQGTILDIW